MLQHVLAVLFQQFQIIMELAIAQQTFSLLLIQSDIVKNALIIAFLVEAFKTVILALQDLQNFLMGHVYAQKEIMLIKTLWNVFLA